MQLLRKRVDTLIVLFVIAIPWLYLHGKEKYVRDTASYKFYIW